MAKPSLMVLMGSSKPDEDEIDEESYEVSDEEVDAAKIAMSALKSGDAKKFAAAICSLLELHDSREPDEDEAEEKEEY